jgi:signal transduction histidine kinase
VTRVAAWYVTLLVAALAVAAALALRLRLLGVQAARVVHEARGPLCTVLLGLERLAAAGSEPGVVGALELELRRAALALDDLSRAPARRPAGPVRPVDVGELLALAAPAWHALADEHGARLSVDAAGDLHVTGDAVRLAQACGNLVANAVEHGGGEVRVRARALGAAVRIEVSDAGPGLPAPVDALVARARHRRGRRGHGLAIAAAVAARHGGRLAAGPASHGARLVLELPAAPVPPDDPAPLRPAIARAPTVATLGEARR